MTFTKLVVGTPRWPVRPPRGNPDPCTEELITGEVLFDSGFELQSADTGETEIPNYEGGEFRWDSGKRVLPPDKPYWNVRGSGEDDRLWSLVQTNPRSGFWHAHAEASSTGFVGGLEPIRQFACGSTFHPWACRVAAGYTVDWSIWLTTNDLTGATVAMSFQFYDEAESTLLLHSSDQPMFSVVDTYEQFTLSATAPIDAYWLIATAHPSNDAATQIFDADDASLVVTAA